MLKFSLVLEGDNEHHFTIGRDQGNVQLGKTLDRETCSSYNLTISATDGVHTAYTKVNFLYFKIIFDPFYFHAKLEGPNFESVWEKLFLTLVSLHMFCH